MKKEGKTYLTASWDCCCSLPAFAAAVRPEPAWASPLSNFLASSCTLLISPGSSPRGEVPLLDGSRTERTKPVPVLKRKKEERGGEQAIGPLMKKWGAGGGGEAKSVTQSKAQQEHRRNLTLSKLVVQEREEENLRSNTETTQDNSKRRLSEWGSFSVGLITTSIEAGGVGVARGYPFHQRRVGAVPQTGASTADFIGLAVA